MTDTKANRVALIDRLFPIKLNVSGMLIRLSLFGMLITLGLSDILIRLTRSNIGDADDNQDAKGKHTPQRMGNFNGSDEYCYLQKVVGIVRVHGR